MGLKRTPLHDRHLGLGARMVPFAGFEMPLQYSGIVAEHLQVRRAVGLFDVSHMGEVRVRGPRALDALQWLLSNDVAAVAVGQAQYNVMCNERGGVIDDLVIYRLGEHDFLVCTNAANRDADFAWMLEHNPHPGEARFEDEGDAWAQLAVQGPRAADTLQGLTPVDLAALRPFRLAPGVVAGIEGCIVARTGYTGEDGFEVFLPADRAGAAFDALLQAGEPHGIVPVGLGARDTLRLEVRFCLYGHELDADTSPLQAGLGWITKVDKPGGFLGRDAIVARKATDPTRLAGLVLEGGRVPREGMDVVHEGEVVGRVTSGTRSPVLNQGICLAYVRRDLARAGTRLGVDIRGRIAEGEVIKGPFHRRQD